eukprot:comp19971_c0_seq1/m.38966 comp19971_c0_seq1/g.38966  ORF comp19971_c0_seq1/g.38966 comp19971_c0_seq1/m.38966 type:complete len:327 (-) comp19971_c0_seq1:803-1783(-)
MGPGRPAFARAICGQLDESRAVPDNRPRRAQGSVFAHLLVHAQAAADGQGGRELAGSCALRLEYFHHVFAGLPWRQNEHSARPAGCKCGLSRLLYPQAHSVHLFALLQCDWLHPGNQGACAQFQPVLAAPARRNPSLRHPQHRAIAAWSASHNNHLARARSTHPGRRLAPRLNLAPNQPAVPHVPWRNRPGSLAPRDPRAAAAFRQRNTGAAGAHRRECNHGVREPRSKQQCQWQCCWRSRHGFAASSCGCARRRRPYHMGRSAAFLQAALLQSVVCDRSAVRHLSLCCRGDGRDCGRRDAWDARGWAPFLCGWGVLCVFESDAVH